jgi:hypothetical protein
MYRYLLVVILVISTTSLVNAADLTFNGFASIGVGRVLDDDDTFPEVDLTGKSSFYDDEVSFKPDTIFALQSIAELNDGLSFTAQIVGKGSSNFDAKLEWAYASYKPSDNWSFSAGKKRVPLYYYSDFLDVGYAYHWIRPPISVYSQPMTTYEGLQGTYSFLMGDWDASVSYYYGNSKFDAVSNDNDDKTTLSGREDSIFDYDALTGIVFDASYDWIRIRGTYAQAQFTASAVIPVVGQSRITLLDEYVDFLGIAVFLTPGNWTLGAEYTDFEFDDIVNGEENWFITAGYRIDSFLPHITYTHSENKDNIFDGDDVDNITVGLRWDFHPSAALKFEYSENDIDAGAGGTDSDAELLAMSIDLFF